jgi:hypothetical protein
MQSSVSQMDLGFWILHKFQRLFSTVKLYLPNLLLLCMALYHNVLFIFQFQF